MQNPLKSALLGALLLCTATLIAQTNEPHIICEGQTLQLKSTPDTWGELSWEFSTDAKLWESIGFSGKETIQPERTGYYRLKAYDASCDETHYSSEAFVEVRESVTVQELHSTFAGYDFFREDTLRFQTRWTAEAKNYGTPRQVPDELMYVVNDEIFEPEADGTFILTGAVGDFEIYATARIGEYCAVSPELRYHLISVNDRLRADWKRALADMYTWWRSSQREIELGSDAEGFTNPGDYDQDELTHYESRESLRKAAENASIKPKNISKHSYQNFERSIASEQHTDQGLRASGPVPCENPYPQADGLEALVSENDETVTLSWDPVLGSLGCRISYRPAGTNPWITNTVLQANLSEYVLTIADIEPDTPYEWRVRCGCQRNPTIAGPWSESDFFTSPDFPNCEAPFPQAQDLNATVLSDSTGVTLDWDAGETARKCRIQYGVVDGPLFRIDLEGAGLNGYFLPSSELIQNKEYRWRVRCGCELPVSLDLIAGPNSAWDYFSSGGTGNDMSMYPDGTKHCTPGGTEVVEVLNPGTGRIWMDRNLGAAQKAEWSYDPDGVGDLYQWGRFGDGHQCRNSTLISSLADSPQPDHGDFIVSLGNTDWLSTPNDNLWQGTDGVNNPCPDGFRLPTQAEFAADVATWPNAFHANFKAINAVLRLPSGGFRNTTITPGYSEELSGTLRLYYLDYYTSTLGDDGRPVRLYADTEWYIDFGGLFDVLSTNFTGNRRVGRSVRCIKDGTEAGGTVDSLACGDAVNTGVLLAGTAADGVMSEIPYSGGNGNVYFGQQVGSTGITGLTATLGPGNFSNGDGTLTYTVTGMPSGIGTASFALDIGGQTCTLTREVIFGEGSINSLDCENTANTGSLSPSQPASGVSTSVPYGWGNGDAHDGQEVASTGVLGLTATLAPGNFNEGPGSLTYTISGTPEFCGTASFALDIGGQSCVVTRFVQIVAGSIDGLQCQDAEHFGTLSDGLPADEVSSAVPYTGGNGGCHLGESVQSTGVTGLTAELDAGTFDIGAGTLIYNITGTPQGSGTASFALNIGGQACVLSLSVISMPQPNYPSGTVHCIAGGAQIVDVVNPTTGTIWMDRNLGASQAATASNDPASYGDLYQWGRFSDGHQCRNSETTTTNATTVAPNQGNSWDGKFILEPSSPWDWLSSQANNLWQGVNGINNPCPQGYRIPSEAEWLSWGITNSSTALNSALKLPATGFRDHYDDWLFAVGSTGFYWSSTASGTEARNLAFQSSNVGMNVEARASGFSVRCIKD